MKRAILAIFVVGGIVCQRFAIAAESAACAADPSGSVDRNTSEIRLYGRGDFDVTHSTRPEGGSVVTADLWRGSRAGLKGRGCLGAGWSVIGHLESGFGTKDGRLSLMQDKLFGRQAYAGLESALGTVTFGRQYPVSDAAGSIVDIALPGILSPYKSQFYWQIDRLEKAVMYSSPTAGGIQARMGYAFGGKSGAPGSSTTTAGFLYRKPRLEAGISLESWRTSDFGEPSAFYSFWNLAASYDLGAAVLVAGFSSDDANMDVSSTTAVASRTYALGVTVPSGTAGKVVMLLQLVKPEAGEGLQVGILRYNHSLSKRTDLYSQVNLANRPAAIAYGVESEVFVGARYRFDVRLWGK